jgi:4-amino-4-deoxy-L-arabinose transferase-like glycosyltransferase
VRRSLLTVILLAGLTFAAGLGRQAMTDADEAYYAQAAREMVASGDWLTPHYNFSDRWQKPVLYYWLTAALYVVVGTSEWAARAWSALSGVGLAALTFYIARRTSTFDMTDAARAGRTAWLAGAIVSTSFGYFAEARLALPDLALALCVTGSIAATLRAAEGAGVLAWIAAGLAGGAGFLLKGPVAVAVPAVVLLPVWWLERRRLRVTGRGVLVALACWSVVGLPWYAAMTATHGVPYLQSFFVADNFERFTTTRFNAPRPVWNYPAVLAGGLMPWTLFAIGPLLGALRRPVLAVRQLSAREGRLWMWALAPLLLFMLSVGQQPRYILPVLPPLAVLLSHAITRRAETTPSHLRPPAVAFSLLLVALAATLVRLRPMLVTVPPLAPWLGAVALIGAAVLVLTHLGRARGVAMPAALAVAAATLLLTVQFGALAGRRPEAVEVLAAAVHAHRHGAERVGPYRAFVRNLVFYTGLEQEDLFDQASAIRFLQSTDRVLLVTTTTELPSLERAAGLSTVELARVDYLNTANLRLDALLRPRPEAQLETVVLVANR